jgi:hypothetical protein
VAEADLLGEGELRVPTAEELQHVHLPPAVRRAARRDAHLEVERLAEAGREADGVVVLARLLEREVGHPAARVHARRAHLRAREAGEQLGAHPRRQVEQPGHRLRGPPLPPHRGAEGGEQRMQRDGVDADAVLVTPPRAPGAPVRGRREPDAAEVGRELPRVVRVHGVHAHVLAVPGEVPVAAHAAEQPEERGEARIVEAHRVPSAAS